VGSAGEEEEHGWGVGGVVCCVGDWRVGGGVEVVRVVAGGGGRGCRGGKVVVVAVG